MMYDLPPVTRALLIANVAIFLLEQIPSLQPLLLVYGALWPIGPAHPMVNGSGQVVLVGFHFWQLVTYAFLHGGWGHIFFNMFALWMFGSPIEHLLGAKHYTFYYFFCAVTAAAAHLLVAFGVMYPRMKMFLIFFPVPMPAWVFVLGYIVLELFFGVSGYESGVAHFAHLGGAIGGFVLLQYWRGKLPIKPKRILTR